MEEVLALQGYAQSEAWAGLCASNHRDQLCASSQSIIQLCPGIPSNIGGGGVPTPDV